MVCAIREVDIQMSGHKREILAYEVDTLGLYYLMHPDGIR